MTQTEMLFGSTLGQILRDEGMAQVEENSGNWKTTARERTEAWINSMPAGTIFTGEDIRLDLQDAGLEEPHHPNAWSAVIGGRIRVWLKSNRIRMEGWKAGSDPKAHARRMIAYRIA
jgi:hypothetical protein